MQESYPLATAQRRIRRHSLLPHVHLQWHAVVSAMKRLDLYDRMTSVERGADETLGAYTVRFADAFARTTDRVLLVNVNSALSDGQHGLVEAAALPRWKVAVLFALTGSPRVLGTEGGVSVVCAALEAAGVKHCVDMPRV